MFLFKLTSSILEKSEIKGALGHLYFEIKFEESSFRFYDLAGYTCKDLKLVNFIFFDKIILFLIIIILRKSVPLNYSEHFSNVNVLELIKVLENVKNNQTPSFKAEGDDWNFTFLKAIKPAFKSNQNLDFVIDLSTTKASEMHSLALLKGANEFYLLKKVI